MKKIIIILSFGSWMRQKGNEMEEVLPVRARLLAQSHFKQQIVFQVICRPVITFHWVSRFKGVF